ncbi:MAG: universal stress protein [Planctomycetaceae bacterium]|nr:universal stress protein [Planctomycetaceae bacterium]
MTFSIRKILVPTDFSDFSVNAANYAIELAKKFDAEVTLLYVLQDAVALFPEPGVTFPAPGNYLQELQESAKKSLERLCESLPEEITINTELRNGPPFVEILRCAREGDYDMIVLGTHGRSGLAHVLLGSVAEKVVRKAECPVLTVRPDEHKFEMP